MYVNDLAPAHLHVHIHTVDCRSPKIIRGCLLSRFLSKQECGDVFISENYDQQTMEGLNSSFNVHYDGRTYYIAYKWCFI